MTLRGEEFLRRFLQHILPTGFVKVRHCGIFAHASKAKALKRLRASLKQQGGNMATRAILALLARTTPEPPIPQCPLPESPTYRHRIDANTPSTPPAASMTMHQPTQLIQ
jgi:hypothetical protein